MKNSILLLLCLVMLCSCKRPNRIQNGTNTVSEERYPKDGTPSTDIISNKLNSRTNNNKTSSPKSVADLFKKLEKSVFIVLGLNDEVVSQGSGFFIAPGIGVTNYHVLQGTDAGYLLINNESYEITEILASSPPEELDYIIFKTIRKNNSYLKVSNRVPNVGDDIFAIGSPKGLSNSLTKGAISGFRDNNRIQIDATIDQGSSGGPLFNLQGEVIGITTSGLDSGSELNFAVNIQSLPYQKFAQN